MCACYAAAVHMIEITFACRREQSYVHVKYTQYAITEELFTYQKVQKKNKASAVTAAAAAKEDMARFASASASGYIEMGSVFTH